MSKYIGTPVVNVSVDTVDVTGDITTTDTTPEVIIVNNTHEDTDGGREGKVTFKGQQSGGEETTLAQIQASHDGTSDDQKGDLIFKTNDGSDGASPTERVRIDSAGNFIKGHTNTLAVGGITPTVQVHGDGYNNSSILLTNYANDADPAILQFGRSRTGTIGTAGTVLQDGDNIGNINWAGDDGTDIGSPAARISGQVDGTPSSNNIPGRLVFLTSTGGSQVERMRIDSSGKVGIGTDSPLGEVTIAKDAGGNAPTSVTAANTYLQLGSDDFGPSNNGKFMIGFGYTDATNTNSPAYIGFEETSTSGDTKGDLTFYTRNVTTDTAPTVRMRIDEDGIVTKPNQPVYYYIGGTSLATNTVTVTKPSTALISSSDYSTSTGRFTAPVAGKYIFTVWGLFYPVDNANTITVYSRKNGSTYGQNVQANPYYVSTGNQHHTISATVIVDLAANDYHEWAVNRGSNTGNAYVSQWNQSGYLLG